MIRFAEFDAAEMSLSSYLLVLDQGAKGPFAALPVFPSRAFRHNGIYVNGQSSGDVRTGDAGQRARVSSHRPARCRPGCGHSQPRGAGQIRRVLEEVQVTPLG